MFHVLILQVFKDLFLPPAENREKCGKLVLCTSLFTSLPWTHWIRELGNLIDSLKESL